MVRTDPEYARLYAEHYAKLNVFAQRVGNRPSQTCVTDRMFMSKKELFATEFYDGFMKPQDVHSLLNVFLLADGERGTRIALGRSPSAGEWEQEHVELLRLFAPHVHRAALINRQLELYQIGTEGAVAGLDHMAQGVVVVDAESRVLFVNQVGERMFAEADGLVKSVGGISAADGSETLKLRRMVAEVANETAMRTYRSALTVTKTRHGGYYSLLIVPLHLIPGWFLSQRSGAVILIRDPGRSASAPPSHLRQLYGLTTAETAVTMEIVRGGGLKAAAKVLTISLATARTHLKHAFEKTATHRQSELVRLVVEMQAGLTVDGE